jgi:hypothetical protein
MKFDNKTKCCKCLVLIETKPDVWEYYNPNGTGLSFTFERKDGQTAREPSFINCPECNEPLSRGVMDSFGTANDLERIKGDSELGMHILSSLEKKKNLR